MTKFDVKCNNVKYFCHPVDDKVQEMAQAYLESTAKLRGYDNCFFFGGGVTVQNSKLQ